MEYICPPGYGVIDRFQPFLRFYMQGIGAKKGSGVLKLLFQPFLRFYR